MESRVKIQIIIASILTGFIIAQTVQVSIINKRLNILQSKIIDNQYIVDKFKHLTEESLK